MRSAERDAETSRYLIQIERPGKSVSMDEARSLLEPLGVTLDPTYGPIPVNPRLGRYVVRGTATEETREKARELEGVKFFGDVKISGTPKTSKENRRS